MNMTFGKKLSIPIIILIIASLAISGLALYNQTKTEISIDINNQKTEFEVAEIKQDYLKLKYKGLDDSIEFES